MGSKELVRYREKRERAEKQRQEEERGRHKQAAERASKVWSELSNATNDHPYLKTKGIKVTKSLKVTEHNELVIPAIIDNSISTLQYIQPDGQKRFMFGGKSKGAYFPIRGEQDVIYIAEGYSTGMSIHMATGKMIYVCFNCHNIHAVTALAKEQYVEAEVIIAGDDDFENKINSGRKYAEKAAKSHKASIVFPLGFNDFNDAHQSKGLETVKQLLEQAKSDAYEEDTVDLICMDDVDMVPVEWLWEKRIALGKVTVIAGQPGLGKSQITAMLCANITGQISFPDGEKAPLGDVLILSAEDDPADTIKPRLIAAGADLKRCHFFNGIKTKSSGRDATRLFDLSADADPLENILQNNREIKMMIIDPVSAYQGKPITRPFTVLLSISLYIYQPDFLPLRSLAASTRSISPIFKWAGADNP